MSPYLPHLGCPHTHVCPCKFPPCRYLQDLAAAWEDYTDTYEQLQSVHAELAAAAAKQHAGHKRKLEAVQQEADALLLEAGRRVAKLRKGGGMGGLGGLAAALQAVAS